MTQRDRILVALRRAGARGITQLDFDAPDVIDGGAPVKRVAARIDELRNRGHWIASQRDPRLRVARYVLVEADTLTVAADVEPPAPAPPPPTASPFDPWSEWS